MIVRDKYLVVEKVTIDEDFQLSKNDINHYQTCKTIQAPEGSGFSNGDILLVGNNICFDKATHFGMDAFYISANEVFGVLKDGIITASENIVYIKADKYEKTKIISGGMEFYNDTSYKPLARKNVTQSGIVLTACKRAKHSAFEHELHVDVSPGDKVYCHHFLTDSDNERELNGEMYYELAYENLYCKIIDNEISMLNDWNFVSPIELEQQEVDGLIVSIGKSKELRVGVINHTSKSLTERGINVGDKVYFKKGREYSMDVEDETFYRIETRDILCKYEKMEALKNIVIVKPIKESNEKSGMIQSISQNPIPDKGEVLSVGPETERLNKGDIVLFRKNAYSEVTIDEEKVLLIESKNIYAKV